MCLTIKENYMNSMPLEWSVVGNLNTAVVICYPTIKPFQYCRLKDQYIMLNDFEIRLSL